MAIREVRIMGDDILEKQCKPVTKMTMRTKILIEDMLDTMNEKYGVLSGLVNAWDDLCTKIQNFFN